MAAATAALPLSEAFSKAYAQLSQQEPGVIAAPAAAELLELLEHCELLVERAALFSRNEEAEDLSTASMRYLLVPFLKADLLNSMATRSAPQRLRQVQAAQAGYCQFLQRCAQYGLLGASCCRAAYEAQEAGQALDPGAARSHKVERFKRSRAVAGLIAQLQARQRRAAGGDEEAGTEGGPPGGVGGWDEEDERLLWASQLEAAAIRALDARPLLEQELQLLQRAAAASSSSQHQQQQHGSQALADDRSSSSVRKRQQQQQEQQAAMQQAMAQRLADIAGQLSLGSSRDKQAIRQQVLRPGHILPTMTVEQQADIEVAQAREREARQREADEAARAAAADARSDDEEGEAAALAKQRAWDDFTDDNPRGWGNSKLRPCA